MTSSLQGLPLQGLPPQGLRARLRAEPPSLATLCAMGKPAATLTLLLTDANQPTEAVFIRRAANLRRHAGEIAFPGGRYEATDQSLSACVLRETHEEVGLAPHRVSLLGWLDPLHSRAGYAIAPAVGVAPLAARADLIPDSTEVADIFTIPFDFLMNPANHRMHGERRAGRYVAWHAMPWQDYYVWGVTATIVKNVFRRAYDTPR